MDFVHDLLSEKDTIAAIATPPGTGGVAIIRISGKKALAIANKIFSKNVWACASHTAHFGKIYNKNKEVLDEGLLLPMHAPKSYTGEDVVELHCHGGILLTKKILEATFDAGARPAKPGEFTQRAFLNGKMDLTKAEAVQQLIGSKNEQALKVAHHQLSGRLYQTISSIQNKLFEIAAILEAWVDFPEEGLEFASKEELQTQLSALYEELGKLISSFHEGKKLELGISLCLLGMPNVGKSSLLNALIQKERAIVTEIPGTTRDLIQEEIQFGGWHFHLMDTAGLRETEEVIEKEGIRRSLAAAKEADLIIFVADVQKGMQEFKRLLPLFPKEHTLLVWNKCDLPYIPITDSSMPHQVFLSAKTGEGLESLKKKVHQLLTEGKEREKDEIIITNQRHYQALLEAQQALQQVIQGLKGDISAEFVTADMKQVLFYIGKIIGKNITEEVLNHIFSKFCVGK